MENPTKTDASFTESLYRQANAYFSTQACGQYATRAFFAKAWIILLICLYVLPFVIAPLILIDLPLWLIAIALCLMYFVVTVISVFILLMPTEEMEHARYDGNNNIDDAWAAEVMRHNVDFSPDNRLVNALAGGANLNVIHYLFPSACHVLYSDLASLVETVSQKYSIYYRKQSLTDVVRIHIKYLTQIQRSSA